MMKARAVIPRSLCEQELRTEMQRLVEGRFSTPVPDGKQFGGCPAADVEQRYSDSFTRRSGIKLVPAALMWCRRAITASLGLGHGMAFQTQTQILSQWRARN